MKSLKMNIPEGYVIDIEKSNLTEGEVVFKKQKVSYDNIIRKLFLYKKHGKQIRYFCVHT